MRLAKPELFLMIHCLPLAAQQAVSLPNRVQLPRFELGFAAADIRTGCIGRKNCSLPSAGIGVEAALNLSPQVALQATWLETPTASKLTSNEAGGRETELLAGVRGELRARHFGFYSSGDLGYRRWGQLITGVTFTPPSATAPQNVSYAYGSRTDFAAHFAGGVEVSPTLDLHIRGQVGDLLLDQGGQWTSNLQPSVSIMYGFGEPVLWSPPRYVARDAHPFFDKTNLAVLTVNTLASTADNVTTYQFTQRGLPEGDPITRPLVKYGIPGQISSEVLEAGVLVAGMYGLHRLHRHWLERLAPLVDATGHAILAYRNTLAYSRSQPTR